MKRNLKRAAQARNRTFSDVVREYLEEHIEEQSVAPHAAANLLRGAQEAEKKGYSGPPDLSVHHTS